MSASDETVAGTKVPGSTNVSSGHENFNAAVATTKDDVASINAARSGMIPVGRGTKTSIGRQLGKGVGGQTDGGY